MLETDVEAVSNPPFPPYQRKNNYHIEIDLYFFILGRKGEVLKLSHAVNWRGFRWLKLQPPTIRCYRL